MAGWLIMATCLVSGRQFVKFVQIREIRSNLKLIIMKFILPIVLFFCCLELHSQGRWSVELMGAGVYNVPMPLTIHQQGQPDIQLTARYRTEPLVLPVYYDARVSRWEEGRSWELEFTHHKLYLNNTTGEVQKFNISHGFNLLMVNRGFDRQEFRYRGGAGVVIAHPESQIRGLAFGSSTDDNDGGYYLTGPVIQASINRPIDLGEHFFINAEARVTFAYASVKVARGNADVYSLVFHLMLGMGWGW